MSIKYTDENDIESLRKTNEWLGQRNNKLFIHYLRYRRKNEQLKEQLESATEGMDRMEIRIHELEDKIKNLDKEKVKAMSDCASAEGKMIDLKIRIRELEWENDGLKAYKESNIEHADILEGEIERLRDQVQAYANRCSELEEEKKEIQRANVEACIKNSKLKERNDHLEDCNRSLEQTCENLRKEITNLKEDNVDNINIKKEILENVKETDAEKIKELFIAAFERTMHPGNHCDSPDICDESGDSGGWSVYKG